MFSCGVGNSIVTEFGFLIHSFEAVEVGRSPARFLGDYRMGSGLTLCFPLHSISFLGFKNK